MGSDLALAGWGSEKPVAESAASSLLRHSDDRIVIRLGIPGSLSTCMEDSFPGAWPNL